MYNPHPGHMCAVADISLVLEIIGKGERFEFKSSQSGANEVLYLATCVNTKLKLRRQSSTIPIQQR